MCESLTAQPPGALGCVWSSRTSDLVHCKIFAPISLSTFSVLVSVLLGLAYIFLLYKPVPVLDDVLIFSVYF